MQITLMSKYHSIVPKTIILKNSKTDLRINCIWKYCKIDQVFILNFRIFLIDFKLN